MPLEALTIDFWNTLVVAHTNGPDRQQQRLDHLLQTARACRPEMTADGVEAAYAEAVRRFNAAWEEEHRTPTTAEIVRCVCEELTLELEAAQHEEAVTVFEEGLLHHPPELAPGVPEALDWAAGRYRLGLISDTMFSPGRVIRLLLEQHDLLRYFDAFVFSDEAGFSKPDVRAFRAAADALGTTPARLAHIGDLRRTDVAGAKKAGATAIQYTGVYEDADTAPLPDLILAHWRALPEGLASGSPDDGR